MQVQYLAFITDIHGNLNILKKFLESCENHNLPPAFVILGGDITGSYRNYLKLTETEESFEKWKEKSLREALALLDGYPGRTFAMLGNDDFESYCGIMDQDSNVESLNYRIVRLEEIDHYLVGFQYVPPTPFMTRFELSEKELEKKLKALLEQVPDHKKAIWIFHSPPYDSGLDNTSDLLDGKIIRVKTGSRAVRKAIEKYKPKLFLCGHIHESPGKIWIGSTLCINPGSPISTIIPQAVMVDLNDMKEFKLIPMGE